MGCKKLNVNIEVGEGGWGSLTAKRPGRFYADRRLTPLARQGSVHKLCTSCSPLHMFHARMHPARLRCSHNVILISVNNCICTWQRYSIPVLLQLLCRLHVNRLLTLQINTPSEWIPRCWLDLPHARGFKSATTVFKE